MRSAWCCARSWAASGTGGWLGGRMADRYSRRLAMYGWIQLGIGLWALGMPPALAMLRNLVPRFSTTLAGLAVGIQRVAYRHVFCDPVRPLRADGRHAAAVEPILRGVAGFDRAASGPALRLCKHAGRCRRMLRRGFLDGRDDRAFGEQFRCRWDQPGDRGRSCCCWGAGLPMEGASPGERRRIRRGVSLLLGRRPARRAERGGRCSVLPSCWA